ncbi:MAG TPA: DUF4845 domain-containing protein [Steroidobacteraceae bacterium]|nr:DUF4845 domain-containing protein [Steroidobacteraceae bacterium]
MRHTQRGITFIGLCVLVTFAGLFVYAGIRLFPIYVEYMGIVKAMDNLKGGGIDGGLSEQSIRMSLARHFEIEDVKSLNWKDVQIKREGLGWNVHAEYDATTPFVGNLSFLAHFDKTVTIAGAGGP